MAKKSKGETAIQADVMQALRKAGYLVFRLQSGKVNIGARWLHLGTEGTPDLLVVGRSFLEVKTDEGELSPAQINMHRRIRHHGEQVHVVRSVKEALAAVMGGATDLASVSGGRVGGKR